MKDLKDIQQKLKAAKTHFNKFGKYKYRSVEDIYEAVKPLLEEPLLISDEVVLVGDRLFVKAVATYGNKTSYGWAEIPKEMAGMSAPQITGAASSYARKYALSALFLLDDNKDVDSDKPDVDYITLNEKQITSAKEWYKKHANLELLKSKYNISPEQEALIING